MQFEAIIAILGIVGTIAVIMFIVGFIVYGLLLGVALGPAGGENRELGSTFVTALLMALSNLAGIIPIVGFILACVLQWYFIKSRHETGWGGAIVAWIIVNILVIIVVIVLLFAFLGGLAALLGVFP
ncbi:MAG: hypothetical protein ACXAEF_00520 [Candidatus Thorarchaeota archaeon]|jgi:hypothetical protein